MRRRVLVLLAIAACGHPGKGKTTGTSPGRSTSSTPPSAVAFEPLAPEVDRATTALALPPVPAFTLPALESGLHSVREMRVDGERLLGQSIKVLGTVTWIGGAQLRLGSAADAVASATVWVVDVKTPRPKLAIGDRVIVSGTWTQKGKDLLLVFTSVEPVGSK